ncbi:MAG: hypothetical protein HY096_00250 [Nitrospinae bacterium]|nr:hypothetical protein [Nitrospinota bacterium]MBI5750346.1 hypothetical protein [Nitrospinota bacterium]
MSGKVSSISEVVIKGNLAVRHDGKTIEAKRSHNFENPQKAIRGNIKEKAIEMAIGVDKGKKINIHV